jgi:hypothetical protein
MAEETRAKLIRAAREVIAAFRHLAVGLLQIER